MFDEWILCWRKKEESGWCAWEARFNDPAILLPNSRQLSTQATNSSGSHMRISIDVHKSNLATKTVKADAWKLAIPVLTFGIIIYWLQPWECIAVGQQQINFMKCSFF